MPHSELDNTPVNGQGRQRVLVAGAGPVGLFLALKLGQAGIEVDVFEKLDKPSEALRASGFHGPVQLALKDAGLLEKAEAMGNRSHGLCWQYPPADNGRGSRVHGETIARIENGLLVLPQAKFVKILLPEVLKTGKVNIHFNSELSAISDDGKVVTATVTNTNTGATKDLTGAYLVCADGGKSTARKLLGISFPGHTWPERLIATEVMLKNEEVTDTPAGFVMHPVHCAAHIPLTKPVKGEESLWRYTMAVDPEDQRPDEEIMTDDNLADMYERVMVGPRPLEYEIRARAVYRIHQRCARTFKRGRCLLAGDAAHLNNPFGAMGLATGLLDAEALADSLALVMNENVPEAVLDIYADERRRVFQFFVDPTTTQNKIRVANDAGLAQKEDWFLRMLQHPQPGAMEAYRKHVFNTWRTDMRKLAAEQGMFPPTYLSEGVVC